MEITINDLLKFEDNIIDNVKIKFNQSSATDNPLDLYQKDPEIVNTQWLFWKEQKRYFYMTLVIRDYEPVWAYIVGLVKSGFKSYNASIWVLHNFLIIVSMALSLLFAGKRNKRSGIVFISLAILLILSEYYKTIISLFI